MFFAVLTSSAIASTSRCKSQVVSSFLGFEILAMVPLTDRYLCWCAARQGSLRLRRVHRRRVSSGRRRSQSRSAGIHSDEPDKPDEPDEPDEPAPDNRGMRWGRWMNRGRFGLVN